MPALQTDVWRALATLGAKPFVPFECIGTRAIGLGRTGHLPLFPAPQPSMRQLPPSNNPVPAKGTKISSGHLRVRIPAHQGSLRRIPVDNRGCCSMRGDAPTGRPNTTTALRSAGTCPAHTQKPDLAHNETSEMDRDFGARRNAGVPRPHRRDQDRDPSK